MSNQAKSSSRWGSFLQNIESRLDTILADEPTATGSSTPVVQKTAASTGTTSARSSIDSTRLAQAKRPDRLQERLARAAANKAGGTASTRESSVQPSPNIEAKEKKDEGTVLENISNGEAQPASTGEELESANGELTKADVQEEVEDKTGEEDEEIETPVQDEANNTVVTSVQTNGEVNSQTSTSANDQSADYEERIEALQAKPKYLIDEGLKAARSATQEHSSCSLESELAKRDERVALLMQEGLELSQKELRHTTIIRNLRIKAAEEETRYQAQKKSSDQAERQRKDLADKLAVSQRTEKERSQALNKALSEVDRLSNEVKSQNTQLSQLKVEAENNQKAQMSAELAQTKEQLDLERAKNASLEETVSNAKTERELSDLRTTTQLNELKSNHERDRERAKFSELELKNEIKVLESRLEAMRSTNEEVKSSKDGDAQAKYLRQVEVLQTQYSVASENWRGIESSLLARIATLEKERSEQMKVEAGLRKQIRGLTTSNKTLETESDSIKFQMQTNEEEMVTLQRRVSELKKSSDAKDAEISEAKEEIASLNAKLEAQNERLEILSRQQSPEIPTLAVPTISSPKISSPNDRSFFSFNRKTSAQMSRPGTSSVMRKASYQINSRGHSRKPSLASQFVLPSPDGEHENGPPSIVIDEDIDRETITSPLDTPDRTVGDMFSAATAAAGPSVQLMERMSASVRRLQSEKSATQEELALIQRQRDEARSELVEMMKEVDLKRGVDVKLESVQRELDELKTRYQTTLELMGEKTEQVEELRADIADMKEIYREQLEQATRR